MTTRQPKVHTQLGRSAVQIFAANERMNQMLIEHLDPAAWRAKPSGKVRSIAAIFTHMHNVRCRPPWRARKKKDVSETCGISSNALGGNPANQRAVHHHYSSPSK